MNKPQKQVLVSDAQLIELHLQSRTNEHLGELYDRYIPLVYGVALKYFRNVDDAGDAVTSIFEELVNKIERYHINEFRPWLYTLTKNYCLQKLRKKKHEIPVDFSDKIMETADIAHLLSENSDEKLLEALERCIEKLPEKQKECIQMFFFKNRSYVDITVATCYHLNNVKSYIQNGKRNLKICIGKEYHEAD